MEKKGGGMIIRMDMEEQQFEELENLAVIFEGCFSDGEKVLFPLNHIKCTRIQGHF